MGYQTDGIGYLQIDPPVAPRECSFVNRVSGSLLLEGSASSLRVADAADELLRELVARAPQGWSNWTVCPQGCCLSYDGGDKANYMLPWLVFLMDTFLAPGAAATGVAGMTGVVAVELLWPGDPSWSTYQPLAYQWEIDRFREWVVDRRDHDPASRR